MGLDITFINNSNAVISELQSKMNVILNELGIQCVSFTKANITAAGRVDTGQYRNSITYRVVPSENAVYVGSNLEHAV